MARVCSPCRTAGVAVLGLALAVAAQAAGSDGGRRPTNTFTMIVNAPPAPSGTTSWSHAPLPTSSSRTGSSGRESATSVPLLRGAGTLGSTR